jgi:hypothetical protein
VVLSLPDELFYLYSREELTRRGEYEERQWTLEEGKSFSVMVETLNLRKQIKSSGCGSIGSDRSHTKVSTNEKYQIVGETKQNPGRRGVGHKTEKELFNFLTFLVRQSRLIEETGLSATESQI